MRLPIAFALLALSIAPAQVIRTNSGFKANEIARNDDGSSSIAPLGFEINFFGKLRNSAYVNNNGNITFDAALPTFTPFGLQKTSREIIAAYFADVDTRGPGSRLVTYGQNSVSGHKAFAANYVDVGYYASHDDKLNRFQLVVIDRTDTGSGNFDIEFNYERITWETGDASDGSNGFGGVPAVVGWSNGTTDDGASFELPGSMVSGAFLDGGPKALIRARLNNSVVGRLLFRAREGVLSPGLTVVTGPVLPDGMVGQPYSYSFQYAGVQEPGTWSWMPDVVSPPGLSFSSSGLLNGIPTSPGVYSFTTAVTANVDGESQTVYRRSAVTVRPPKLTIATGCPLNDGVVGRAYAATFRAVGTNAMTIAWSVDSRNSLPPGVTLASSGLLTGIPQAQGTFDFVVRAEATDSNGTEPVEQSCRLTINPASVRLASGCVLPSATIGVPYTQNLAANGGIAPYRFELIGQLPAGLNLSSEGVLTGVPAVPGTNPFRILIGDSRNHIMTQDCELDVVSSPVSAAASCPLPPGLASASYSARLRATGGTAPYSWSVLGTLPPGLSLSPDGILSGRPTGAGPFLFRLLAVDSEGRQTGQPCSISILRGALSIGSCPLPDAALNQPYIAQLNGSGGVEPYTWSGAAQLPLGLSLSSTGVLSGTPVSAGAFTFGVNLRDSAFQSATQSCSIQVKAPALRFNSTCPAPEGLVGMPYAAKFTAAGGTPPYRFTVQGYLPIGLTAAEDGTIAGTPTDIGATSFIVQLDDSAGSRSENFCSIEVGLGTPPELRISELPSEVDAARTDVNIGVELAKPYRLPVSGQLVLAVTPATQNSAGPSGQADPHLRFSNGQTTASFLIPAGSRRASLPLLSTGTVASSVVVSVMNVKAGEIIAPSAIVPRMFQIQATAPVISSGCYTQSAADTELSIVGFTTTRELKNLEVVGSGTSNMTSLTDVSDEYFSRDETVRSGGAFTLRVPYTGPVSAGMSLRLSNSAGTSNQVPLSRCQ